MKLLRSLLLGVSSVAALEGASAIWLASEDSDTAENIYVAVPSKQQGDLTFKSEYSPEYDAAAKSGPTDKTAKESIYEDDTHYIHIFDDKNLAEDALPAESAPLNKPEIVSSVEEVIKETLLDYEPNSMEETEKPVVNATVKPEIESNLEIEPEPVNSNYSNYRTDEYDGSGRLDLEPVETDIAPEVGELDLTLYPVDEFDRSGDPSSDSSSRRTDYSEGDEDTYEFYEANNATLAPRLAPITTTTSSMTSTTVFTTSTVETTEEPVVSLGDDDELKPNLDEFDRVDESDEETNTDDIRVSPAVPSQLMESPDILIGIDMQAASAQTWPNTKNFVSNLVEKLSEFFRFGGCLDEVRLGIFQYSQYETEVNHVITLSNFNKYMGSREGCFTGETDFIQLTNDVLAQLKNLKDPETVLSKGSRPTLENDGAITEIIDIATGIFKCQDCARKGTVERRIQRWGNATRKTLILLHDAHNAISTKYYHSAGKKAADAGVEVIPVAMNSLESLDTDCIDKLAALALQSERLAKFDPFILDTQMAKSTHYIPVYLQRSALFKKYVPGRYYQFSKSEENKNLSDCSKNACCCEKYQK